MDASIEPSVRAIMDSHIPYPQRRQLADEVAGDLEHLAPTGADFPQDALRDLEAIHGTRLFHWSRIFGSAWKFVEIVFAYVPFILSLTWIFTEEVMTQFIIEGGIGMYGLLGLGGLLLGRELLLAFRLLVVRDHSEKNLQLRTVPVLLGAFALMCFGIGCSALGFYVSAGHFAVDGVPWKILVIGAKESVTPIVLCSFFATLTVLAHLGTMTVMGRWGAPLKA